MVSGADILFHCSIAMTSIVWIVVALRFYTRTFLVKKVSIDDWAMLFTTLVYTAFAGRIAWLAHTVASEDMTAYKWISQAATTLYSVFLLYIATTMFLKGALMLFFVKILILPWQRWVMFASLAIFEAVTVAYFFIILFDCHAPKHWLQNQIAGHCLNKDTITIPVAYAASTINAVSDCIFAILPISVVIGLQMAPSTRRIVIGLLFLGFVGSVASFVRIGFLHVLNEDFISLFHGASDIGTMSVIEIGMGIIAPSIATLRPLGHKLKILADEKTQGITKRVRTAAKSGVTDSDDRKTGMKASRPPTANGSKGLWPSSKDEEKGMPRLSVVIQHVDINQA